MFRKRRIGAAPADRGCVSSLLPAEKLRQHQGVVVLLIARGVQKRHRPLLSAATHRLDRLGSLGQLGAITRPELLEATWFVSEPAAQLGARRKGLGPLVQLSALARDPTWPHAIDQRPVAVAGRGNVVDALDPYLPDTDIVPCPSYG